MKKMIAILVLCAFVSVSSAAIMFQAPTEVQAGQTFAINVVADGVTTALAINALTLSGHESFSGNAVSTVAFNTGFFNGTPAVANTGNVVLLTISGAFSTADGVSVPPVAGTVLFTMNVTAGAAGTQIVVGDAIGARTALGLPAGPPLATRWNGEVATLDDFTVNVVPEPMTMALLGLGGLFIRRRRA